MDERLRGAGGAGLERSCGAGRSDWVREPGARGRRAGAPGLVRRAWLRHASPRHLRHRPHRRRRAGLRLSRRGQDQHARPGGGAAPGRDPRRPRGHAGRLRLSHRLRRAGAHPRGRARDPRAPLRPALRARAGDREPARWRPRSRRRSALEPEPLAVDGLVLRLAEALLDADPSGGARGRADPCSTAARSRGPAAFLDAETTRVVRSSELEAVTGLTRYDLARQFRAAFGTSPYRYSLLRRLDRAAGGAGPEPLAGRRGPGRRLRRPGAPHPDVQGRLRRHARRATERWRFRGEGHWGHGQGQGRGPGGRRPRGRRSPTRTRSSFRRPATRSSTWRGTTRRWPRARCAASPARPIVLKRYVNGAEGEPFFQKRAPEKHPDWIETVELRFPSGRTAREIVVRDAAQLLWIVNLGLHRPQPAPGARRRPRASRRAARRSRSRPGRRLGRRAARGAGRARRARRARPARLAQDVGLARHARQRAHRAALELRPGAARGAGARARGGAARARAGDQQVVEGGAPRRLPRLQPEREGPHRGLGVVGAARRPTRASRCRSSGTRSPTAIRRRSRSSPRRRASPSAATRRPASTTPRARSTSCSSCPPRRRPRASATRRGRRTTRSRAASRRASRRRDAKARPRQGTGRRAVDAAAHHRREGGAQGGRARRPRALEGAASRRPRRCCRWTTCSSTRCAAARRTWTRIRVNLRHVPEGERPAEEAPDPDYDPWRGWRPRSRAPKTRSSS